MDVTWELSLPRPVQGSPPPSWCNKETVNTPLSTGRAPCLALSLSRRLSPWSRRTDPDTVSREKISRHGGMKSSQKTINACFVVDIDNVPDNTCHLWSPELPGSGDKCDVEMRLRP